MLVYLSQISSGNLFSIFVLQISLGNLLVFSLQISSGNLLTSLAQAICLYINNRLAHAIGSWQIGSANLLVYLSQINSVSQLVYL